MEKIVVFTPSLNIGGIERILLNYANGLAKNGYDVIYLTLNDRGDFKPNETENLRFENLGVLRLRGALFALVKFLRMTKADVILVANEATLMVYLAKVLSRRSIKIITSQHNYLDIYANVGFKQTFVQKYIYPRCFKVIAVSEGISNMLVNVFKILPTKVVTISNPIDIDEIERKIHENIEEVLPKKYILYVGRFDRIKNIPLLLEAFKLFTERFVDVKLIVIGGGAENDNIKEYISNLELDSNVELLGVKSNPFPYIKNANLIALSSLSEAFPTILLESLCLGKTIVSTPTMGANDILEGGRYGYLSKSLEGVKDFYNVLIQGYLEPFEENELHDYIKSNFSLERKINELECLWKNKRNYADERR